MTLTVVFLDNVDSFTYNLVDEFAKRGADVAVVRNDGPAEPVLALATRSGGPRLLVVSPGPGNPSGAGCCLEVVRGALGQVPLFGVCLGHQALVEALGGTVDRAPAPIHGKATIVRHSGVGPFAGLPNPLPVGRYHSLAASVLPEELEPIATTDGGSSAGPPIVMAVAHRTLPAIGVQFHPESVLTPDGGRLIENVIQWARDVGR